jgi:uncharacterized membrane protein|nr:MAG TPA: Baseplate J like protein [Herelleviridae sp.]
MITKTSATITNLKNLFIEMFLDKTAKVSNVADGSVVNATAFGVAKVAQKAMKDIAIKEAQIFPDTATGVYLDKAAALYGVSPRKGALGSSTYIRVSADPGTVYDTSVTFVNKNGIRFQVDEALTVGESGYGYVKVRSINAGYSTNVPPNSITNVSPQPQGHIECTNEYYAIGGRDSEDDETFRIRIKNNLNILSKNTIEYWTQTLSNIDDRVLKVMSAGLDEKGIYNLYVVSQNGIFFTEEELDTLLESAQGYFGISELNIEGKAVGIGIKNIDWFYVGSERGLDFRVQLQPDYDVATVRQNIQVNLTKYLDFRFWTPGKIVEWDDLLDIVKKTDGVKYVPDEYFFPYYDQQVPANQLPRIRGFVMRDQDGNILYDSDSNLSPLFYPSEPEDLFVGINDSSLNLYQEVYFNVTDSKGGTVEGANISIGNNAVITNDNGQAIIQLANGQYEYIVSASGYIPVEGMFVVLNGSVSIDVQMVLAPYTVTFHVTDEKGGVVPYANVMMDNRTTTTNLQGVASLSARNGNYPYTIEKLGYDEYSGSVVVDGRDKEVYPELEFKVWTITVIVKDKENQLIPNVIVKVNNGEYLTNQHGEAEIPLVNGEYPVTIEKTGYDTLQGEIKVNNQNADVTFEMDFFLYNVEFNISQVNRGNPAEGATIKIEGQPGVLNVNGSGQATIKLKSGNYSYTVQKKGYDDLTGSFNVEGQDTFIQRTLVLKHYNVVITVLDSDNSSPAQGAAVNINGSSYPTNERGQAVVSLQNGTYPYTVTKSGYYDGSSSVTVLDSDNSSVISLKARLYNVIMTVKNPLKEPIKGATVEINATSYQTQDNGEVSLQLKNGTYPFTVVANGMDDYLGELEVVSADIPSFPVNMEYSKYNIVFTVQTDEGVAIENANIHINEKDYQTSQGGLVTVRLSDGQYPYTVTKEGYVQTQGNVEVSGSNKNVLAQLTPISYNITFVVKDNMASPNLLQGVSIDIENEDKTVTTNASGEAIISLKAGKHTASFMKNSYKTETLSFEVTGEATFTQILKKIWNLTFKVTAAGKSGLKDVTVSVSGPAILSGNTVSLKTKDDGTTDPVQVINGAYDWNASLTGYSPEEGVGSVQDADQEKVIELTYGFETTFTTSPATQGVEITIDGNDTITTGQDGIATINLSTGTHTYAYSKTGFLNGTGNVRIEEAEKSVQITLVPGATVTFHTKVGNSALADVKIIVGQSSARALPETIVTNSQGIAAIDLPTGDYQYQIPTTSMDNPNLVEVPSGTFSVATAASVIELDLADYVKYNVTFQTVPSTQDVAISFAKAESPDTPVASGATASNGILTLTYKNGQYIYTAKKSSYKDVTGEFTIAGGDQNITVEMLQISTVTFTVKSQNDSSPIENAAVEMVDRSDSSNKYKGTTNSSGVATMTFDGGEFEWSQDSDADFSEGLDFYTPNVYTLPAQGVAWTAEEFKSNFPKGFCVNPMTEYKQPPSDTVSKLLFFTEDTFTKITGQWDSNHKTFTLNEIVPKSKNTEGYFFWADAGSILAFGGLLDQSAKINLDDIDMGISVENIPEKFDISYEISETGNSVSTILFKEGVIERIQLSNFAFDISNNRGSYFDISIKPKEGVNITLEDWKTVNNVKISFYGKKAISSDIPANKVLHGSYDYTVTPPSPLVAQSGTLNVNAPAINKEILIANNVDVTFKVTAKQPLLTRPQIGDFVYGDKTWSTELDGTKTCVGVITDVRSKDFDFIALRDVDAALYWQDGKSLQPVKNSSFIVLPFTLLPLSNPAIPIENALVKMTSASNNYQQNTNNNGEAVISAALGVDYDYEVSADGYATQNGKVGALNEAKTIEVTLQPAIELTVVVHRNTLDGATDISGVQVVVTENKEGGVQMASGTTSQNGTVVLFVPDGSYKVTFSKDGFESKEETVEVSGKTALNTFLLQIYNTINVQVRRVGSINFLPSILELRQSDGTTVLQTANIGGNGSGNFTNLVYGKYVLYVAESNNAKEMRQEITVNSEGMQVQMNLIPLYDLVVKVLPSGGNVTFTGSDGVQKQASTNVSNNAAFYKIPAGNYSINVTGDAGFEPINTTGVIEQTADQTVNLKYTLTKPNKLVQITSDQSNYQLDTSYKYVSLLIVGRGGENFEYWQSWDEFVLMGGTTGQIVYIPNILMSDISNGQINKITFSGVPNGGVWTEGTECSIRLGRTTYEYRAYNGKDNAQNDADRPMPQGSRLGNYSVYNAKSSGGFAAHMRGTFYCSGSPGSQPTKEETYSSTGPRMQPEGAPGGDGKYGFKSSYENTVLGEVTKPIQSSVVIPVQSIFGGTSKGEAGYLNTESGKRTGAFVWGGAGYGGSDFTSPDGGTTRIAGYGSGQECSPADDDAGNITKPGEGIFCIYYHNEPI